MEIDSILHHIENKFIELFSEAPLMVRSPGRVNLIGEHTDYNEGFVLPAAINRAIYFALTSRVDDQCVIYSYDLKDSIVFSASSVRKSEKRWPNYLLGVIDQLQKQGYGVSGFNCVFGGDIPIGAGLSSSAALEAGLATGLSEMFQLNIEPLLIVKMAQKAENEFVGVQCGIMDQLINVFGREDQVLRLDCRTLEFEYFPFENGIIKIVLCDSQVQRELGASEYNLRRSQCEAGVDFLRKFYPEIRSLRDVNMDQLQENRKVLDPTVFMRCKYVIEENQRVLGACKDLIAGNFEEFGKKMYMSHQGLRDEYQVSCRELDILVEGASGIPGVMGSRMMGAGFGGCTINLVKAASLEKFEEMMSKIYHDRLNKSARMYICEITAGSAVLKEKIMNP